MTKHPAPKGIQTHRYECWDIGKKGERCRITVGIDPVDAEAWIMAIEHIRNPQLVIDRANEILKERINLDEAKSIRKRLEIVKKKINNLVLLAEDASDKDELEDIKGRISANQKEKREIERMLVDIENVEEQKARVDKALSDFIAWCVKVRPFIDDPDYTPSYSEMRRAIVILGIKATVYPVGSKKRFTLDLMPPSIMEALILSQLSDGDNPGSYSACE